MRGGVSTIPGKQLLGNVIIDRGGGLAQVVASWRLRSAEWTPFRQGFAAGVFSNIVPYFKPIEMSGERRAIPRPADYSTAFCFPVQFPSASLLASRTHPLIGGL